MSRLLRIAWREYLAYVRTVGFWLSMMLMPLGLAAAAGLPALMDRTTPTPTLAIIDLTDHGYGQAVRERLKPGEARVVDAPVKAGSAAEAGAAVRSYMTGVKALPNTTALDAAAVIYEEDGAVAIDFWRTSLGEQGLERSIGEAVAAAMRSERLAAAGLSPDEVAALDSLAPKVTAFSPKATGEVSLRDRLPGIVGFGLGMLLWSVIFTGAGILLNSVIEEKSSRIIEVLLASASVPEIMFGKILGVAGVTATVMGVWATLGGTALALAQPQIAADVAAVLLGQGLIFYFAVYLVGGYLMYASLFIAVGAFCETTREAQTLLGPVMILLMVPVLFMGQAIRRPDAPLLETLSWFPPFTPFLMTARAAADPPLWQVAATGALMVVTIAAVVWLAGRAFRAGALSSGRLGWSGVLAKLRRAE